MPAEPKIDIYENGLDPNSYKDGTKQFAKVRRTGVVCILLVVQFVFLATIVASLVYVSMGWYMEHLRDKAMNFKPGRGLELHVCMMVGTNTELSMGQGFGKHVNCKENQMYCSELHLSMELTLGFGNNTLHIYGMAPTRNEWVDIFIHDGEC